MYWNRKDGRWFCKQAALRTEEGVDKDDRFRGGWWGVSPETISSARGGGWGRRGRVPRFAAASWGNGPIYGVKLPILRQDRHMENYAHPLTLGSGFRLSPAER